MEPNGQCRMQPSAFFLMLTLLVTAGATGLLCSAIMTDHWEHVTWDQQIMQQISDKLPRDERIDWLLDGKVARVNLSFPKDVYVFHPNGSEHYAGAMFFVPMFGGLWALCPMISDEELKFLEKFHFPSSACINYLTPEKLYRDGVGQTDWQNRMQNLSISCALVCLIILGCSALVGAFGVLQQQISAVLVTGVMYLLAATFAMFSLAIIHFKHAKCRANENNIDGVIPSTVNFLPLFLQPKSNITLYYKASVSTTGWSLHLGWGGVGTCILVSILWIILSKIMRYNPLSTLLTTLTVL